MTNVHDLTYDLLRRHGVTNDLGNPGSKRVVVSNICLVRSPPESE